MLTPPPFAAEYHHDADLRLLQRVPAGCRRILDLACGHGHRGEVLRHLDAAREVTGLAADEATAQRAAPRLTHCCVADLARGEALPSAIAVQHGHYDCIVLDDALADLPDPLATLAALRPLLAPAGRLLFSVANAQHWTLLDALCRGDLQASRHGLAASGRRQFLAFANVIKLCLDAGWLPRLVDRRPQPAPPGWHDAARALAERQGLDPARFAARCDTLQYYVEARALAEADDDNVPPLTLAVCTNDPAVLRDNLLASPCLAGQRHEILTIEGAGSAAEGFEAARAKARHDLIVLVHQDVYLPRGWIGRLRQQVDLARQRHGERIGLFGVYGIRGTAQGIVRAGRVADRESLLDEVTALPATVDSLDELLLVIPKDSPVRLDPALGYHLYGTDACLAATARGHVAVVIDAPCFHNSKQGDVLPPAYHRAAATLAQKWPERLPIVAPCGIVGHTRSASAASPQPTRNA